MAKITAFMFAVLILFSGCGKDIEEFNKPATYWYNKMVNSVASGSLDRADSYFSSLQSEHSSSALLPEATLIMALAHMSQEEYLIAEHFLDEYNRRYSNANTKEYAEFLKIKSKFLALPNPGRDQGLIDETLKSITTYASRYPNSIYMPLVDTMRVQLELAQADLNEQVAMLYDRLQKPSGAKYYRELKPSNWSQNIETNSANISWYRWMFEGDGSSSWYDFMIPQTRSVVSMSEDDNNQTDDSSWYDMFNFFK